MSIVGMMTMTLRHSWQPGPAFYMPSKTLTQSYREGAMAQMGSHANSVVIYLCIGRQNDGVQTAGMSQRG